MNRKGTFGGEGARKFRSTAPHVCGHLVLGAALVPLLLTNAPALAQCPPTEPCEVLVTSEGHDPTIAMDAMLRFIIAWEDEWNQPVNRSDLLAQRFAADGTPVGGPALLTAEQENDVRHYLPSIAMTPQGETFVAWIGRGCTTVFWHNAFRLLSAFSWGGPDPFPVSVPCPVPYDGPSAVEPSAAYSLGGGGVVTWSHATRWDAAGRPEGLRFQLPLQPDVIFRSCVEASTGPDPICWVQQWQPCVAMSDDGYFVIAWADGEEPGNPASFFDIRLQMYDSNGQAIGSEWRVNENVAAFATSELSPAVAMDDFGNIVCTWWGPRPQTCQTGDFLRVYARRFKYDILTGIRDPGPGEGIAGQFIVGDTEDFLLGSDPNPTVALSPDPQHAGRFVMAWNVYPTLNPDSYFGIRAQYFGELGFPRSAKFRVNQFVHPSIAPTLANSAQHTLAYGADDRFVATWTRPGTPDSVYFTMIPPGYAERTCREAVCLKGDTNGDGLVNGLDIQPFVDALLGVDLCDFELFFYACEYDTNCDCLVDFRDVPCFVTLLLGGACGCAGDGSAIVDCNGNGVEDATDIFNGTSADCNGNFVPDECDIAQATSGDANANGVPDECEPDCNGNGVPDDLDIAGPTSNDANSNGVPDECDLDCNGNDIPDDLDIAGATSHDCDADGVPDECGWDCNGNGIADSCDIASGTSQDCNANLVPDECDLTMPLMPSLDCNMNGIPDECDIASGTSQDKNGNGFPDECESESQGAQGGGSAPMSTGAGAASTTSAGTPEAWAAFHEWCAEQTWGPASPLSGREQFARYVEKLRELGLPLRRAGT